MVRQSSAQMRKRARRLSPSGGAGDISAARIDAATASRRRRAQDERDLQARVKDKRALVEAPSLSDGNAQNRLPGLVDDLDFAIVGHFTRSPGQHQDLAPCMKRFGARGIQVGKIHADAIARDLPALTEMKVISRQAALRSSPSLKNASRAQQNHQAATFSRRQSSSPAKAHRIFCCRSSIAEGLAAAARLASVRF